MSFEMGDDTAVVDDFFSSAFSAENAKSQVSGISVNWETFTKTEKTAVSTPRATTDRYVLAPDNCDFCKNADEDVAPEKPGPPPLEDLLKQDIDGEYTERHPTSHEVVNCTDCGSDGTLICEVCTQGKTECRQCDGTGELSVTVTEQCETCSGQGYTDTEACGVCNQAGTVAVERSCSKCGGSGHNAKKDECHTCGGTGNQDMNCTQCTDGTVTEQCDSCTGAGSVEKTESCPECRRGKVQTEKQCPKCGGTETVDGDRCGNCRGSGVVEEPQSCGNCNARGEITVSTPCEDCSGTGNVRVDCAQCGGDGSIEGADACDACTGRGRIGGTCENCGGTGNLTRKESCSACDGIGEQRAECSNCGGDGNIDIKRTPSCDRCSGSGTADCLSCDGTNYVECGTCHGTGDNHRLYVRTFIFELQEPNTSYRPREIPGSMDPLSWELVNEEVSSEIEDHRLDGVEKVRRRTFEVTIPRLRYEYEGETFEGFLTNVGARYNNAPRLKTYDSGRSFPTTTVGLLVVLMAVAAVIWFML